MNLLLSLHLLILLLSFPALAEENHCVQGVEYWLSLPEAEWPPLARNQTLCGERWFDILRGSRSNQSLWNDTIREFIVATLNNCSTEYAERIQRILGTMERVCGNGDEMRNWALFHEPVIPIRIADIKKFNRGTPAHPLCAPPPEEGTDVPTYLHQKLESLTLEEQVEQSRFYIRVLGLWNLFLTCFCVIMAKRVLSQRGQQQFIHQ